MNTSTKYKEWSEKLKQFRQYHLLAYWDELGENNRELLVDQLENIDFGLMQKLQLLIKDGEANGRHAGSELVPTKVHRLPKNAEQNEFRRKAKVVGEDALGAGTVGVILVAGGQSSRLQYEDPKGFFPVGPVSNRSLFQYYAEQILALERKYDSIIPWFIMTNPFSLQATTDFFQNNDYFGKDKSSIHFFAQRMLPAVDSTGNVLMETKYSPALAPDGHGGLLNALHANRLTDKMDQQELEHLFYFQVDNPLVKIADPVFLGCHILDNADISAKTLKKSNPEEKLGNIVRINGAYSVIEYTELSIEEKNRTTETGELYFNQGSIGIHIFDKNFLKRIAADGKSMPFHVSEKSVKCLDKNGQLNKPSTPNAFKFEQFIFDAFTQTQNICVVEVERSQEFSPIKNKTGVDSPDTARKDLRNYFGAFLKKAGYDVPTDNDGAVMWNLEISPLVALDAEELEERLPSDFTPDDGMVLEA